MVEPVQQFDVISMGRIGVDLHPRRPGVPGPRHGSSGRFLGGPAADVAVTAARLGRSTAVITRTGADSFGAYLHQTLTESGVDNRWVTRTADSATPVAGAPDLEIHTDELDYFAIRAARIFWITGTGLSAEPSRSATLAALKCRDRAATTVLELDWRPAPEGDPARTAPDAPRPGRAQAPRQAYAEVRPHHAEALRHAYAEALRHATVAVGDLDACEIATRVREPHACAEALLAAGVELAVVKRGPKGVLAVHRDGTTADVPSAPTTAADGAGDAFGGALCHGLLSGWELERTVRYAHTARSSLDGALR
ncbi:PfkB family carbohydrate kinase [Streptomyces griseorubiginosus]|uniref:PfkB family carbohydrate kinase n=1 Tax=Streptomyces griseorubiginosus TaxID=67304 RepID=UPI00114088E0|nr:PfkB family carbohydrate kinase [Streptomyces griseorubiginosus]